MATEIKVPALGESVTTATIARWMKHPGDTVAVDEPLVELETDKVTVEVAAPAAGVLTAINYPEGSEVEVGALLGMLDGEASGVAMKPVAIAPAASSPAPMAAPSTAAPPDVAPTSVMPPAADPIRRAFRITSRGTGRRQARGKSAGWRQSAATPSRSGRASGGSGCAAATRRSIDAEPVA